MRSFLYHQHSLKGERAADLHERNSNGAGSSPVVGARCGRNSMSTLYQKLFESQIV